MMDFKNIFLDDYFLKWSDRPLDNSEKFSISCQIPIEMRDIGIDFNSQVNSVILNEMRITIFRAVFFLAFVATSHSQSFAQSLKAYERAGDKAFEKVGYDPALTDSTEVIIFSCIELDEHKYEMVKQNPVYFVSTINGVTHIE